MSIHIKLRAVPSIPAARRGGRPTLVKLTDNGGYTDLCTPLSFEWTKKHTVNQLLAGATLMKQDMCTKVAPQLSYSIVALIDDTRLTKADKDWINLRFGSIRSMVSRITSHNRGTSDALGQ